MKFWKKWNSEKNEILKKMKFPKKRNSEILCFEKNFEKTI